MGPNNVRLLWQKVVWAFKELEVRRLTPASAGFNRLPDPERRERAHLRDSDSSKLT